MKTCMAIILGGLLASSALGAQQRPLMTEEQQTQFCVAITIMSQKLADESSARNIPAAGTDVYKELVSDGDAEIFPDMAIVVDSARKYMELRLVGPFAGYHLCLNTPLDMIIWNGQGVLEKKINGACKDAAVGQEFPCIYEFYQSAMRDATPEQIREGEALRDLMDARREQDRQP